MERSSGSVRLVVEEEKHGNSASIQASCFLGGAMPVGASMPFQKGRMAHNFGDHASWEAPTPVSFETAPVGTYPHGRRLFLMAILSWLFYFLKPWIGYPCLQKSK